MRGAIFAPDALRKESSSVYIRRRVRAGPMRLRDFIRNNPYGIEREWEHFARNLTPFAASLSFSTLRDHLREILEAMADDMASPQTSAQRQEKARARIRMEARLTG